MDIINLNMLGNVITEKLNSDQTLVDLMYILESYTGDDWKKYVNLNTEKYTRNIVFSNDETDIILICWNNHQSSGIHDHPDRGCLLKVLEGELNEYVYIYKSDDVDNNNKMKFLKVNKLSKDQISYKQGKCALHDIRNEKDSPTMSLHIYCPPNYKPNRYTKIDM